MSAATSGASKAHPAAELFPTLDGAELEALASDIREHGLLAPIVIHEGMILDGRNRLRACEKAGIEPRFVEWTGSGSPTLWVLSVNLHRRHLTESQRAMVGARSKELLEAEARERQRALAGTRKGKGGDVGANLRQGRHPKSAERAARIVNVSARSVEHAAKVLKEGDSALVQAVEKGDVAVSAAAKVAALPKAEQRRRVRAMASHAPRSKGRDTARPRPFLIIEPSGISALREKGKRSPVGEARALHTLCGLLRTGAQAWTDLVLAWNHEHRRDMEFVLQESPGVEAAFDDLLSRLTTAQALAFVMARGHVAQVLPNTTLAELAPFFAEAEEALRSRPLHRRWAKKIRVEGLGFHLMAPRIAPQIAVEVTAALLEEKRLRVTYLKPGEAAAKERVLNPLGLLVRDGVLSLVATSAGKADSPPYQMRLDRMRSAARLDDARQEPRRFDLGLYDIGGGVGVQGAPGTMRIRLLIEKGSPLVPEERPLPNQTITIDGERTIIEADVPNTREFLAWLRGYGATVKVLGPKELRDNLAEEIRDLARYYAEG